jgi:hypothetical protein
VSAGCALTIAGALTVGANNAAGVAASATIIGAGSGATAVGLAVGDSGAGASLISGGATTKFRMKNVAGSA